MGQDVRNDSRVCRTPPGPRKDLTWHLRPRKVIIAVGLSFILATSLVYYLMLPPALLPPLPPLPSPLQLTPHGYIWIDGDANFSDTALLEGWPGDGSPENPFIISGLDIDLGSQDRGYCIYISNTRVSFTISHCNLLYGGASGSFRGGAGIYLKNVTNGVLVNNACNYNYYGIQLRDSTYNTVANNTCNSNGYGIKLGGGSNSNTVANNTCNNNWDIGISLNGADSNTVFNNTCNNNSQEGIYLDGSEYNTMANNTCTSNDIGIYLATTHFTMYGVVYWFESNSNTVANNICNNNRIGIYLDDESDFNTVENNTFSGNTEHDIVGEYGTEEIGTGEDGTEEFDPGVLLLVGFAGIIVLGAGWRMLSGIRKFN